MPLKLTIPALESKPLIAAETHPRKISQFTEKLPIARPLEASSQLLEEMELLNRQKIAPDIRIGALEIYRQTIIQLSELLATHYSDVTLPLPEDAKKHAIAAESLWRELAYGYKLALIDQESKLFSIGINNDAALAIQRATDALGQQAMVHYQTYFTTLGTIWSDIHQLYLHAVNEKLETLPISNDADSAPTTINLTYKQVLLMSLVDPQHLAPDDIKLAARYIARHGKLALLHDLATFENPAGIFLVSLNSDKPPIPYVKNTRKTDSSNDILFVTIDLARQVHQDLQSLEAGETPRKSDLPRHVTPAQYLNLLLHLFHHWGIAPSRTYSRTKKMDGVQVGVGLSATCYFVGKATPAESKPELKPTRWQALNISAGGMALRNAGSAHTDIQVGQLICLKTGQDTPWSIGVIRRAVHNTQHQVEIGTQLISPGATVVAIRGQNEEDFTPALLLPEIPALKQAASIIASTGAYTQTKGLELKTGSLLSQIIMTKLVDRTDHFEHFNFRKM